MERLRASRDRRQGKAATDHGTPILRMHARRILCTRIEASRLNWLGFGKYGEHRALMKGPIKESPACLCQHSAACRIARSLIVSVVLSAAPVVEQNPPATPSNLTEGTKIYAQRCAGRSEEHTSELQSPCNLVCRLLLEKKNTIRLISHTRRDT